MGNEEKTRMENDLGRDDIRLLVRRIALPSMLAQFVSVLYSLVDRMYIGHIDVYKRQRYMRRSRTTLIMSF